MLNKSDEYGFKKEVAALEQVMHEGQPHLIRLLATFETKEKYCLIFPWADGNLMDFWQMNLWQKKPTPECHRFGLWFGKQCTGLARGLLSIHRPANAAHVQVSPTYRPPECDTKQPITQRVDIWQLGTVYADFATWMLFGWHGINSLLAERLGDERPEVKYDIPEDKYFDLVKGPSASVSAVLKPSVIKVIVIPFHLSIIG